MAQTETVSISKFRATCPALLDRVRETGLVILVTRKGVPIAQVVPPPGRIIPPHWLGCFRTTGKIKDDIVGPALGEEEWEALHP